MSSPLRLSRPLVTASLLLPAVLYLAYRWQKNRQQDPSSPPSSPQPGPDCPLEVSALQEKLATVRRSRLDTLEEEAAEEASSEGREPQAVTKDAIVTEDTVVKTKAVQEPIFTCTDIRYRHRPASEGVVIDRDSDNIEMVEVREVVIEEGLFEEELTEELDMALGADKVPNVLAALQDPLCLASPPSPHSYSSSPVKSEASSEGRQSTEWSDLIEQDERENFQQVLTSKLSGLDLDGSTRCGDSGVVSPSSGSCGSGLRERQLSETTVASKTRSHSGEDAGIGSEQGDAFSDTGVGAEQSIEDTQLMAYQFHIPDYLCGKLIGKNGGDIKKLKEECGCNIVLKDGGSRATRAKKTSRQARGNRRENRQEEEETKLCSLEGTRAGIDKCLDIIKNKFSENKRRGELTLEQVNNPSSSLSLQSNSVALSLAEGCMHEVFVSSIVGGGHVFLQQPYHPTFHALERLDACMTKIYSQFQCPALPAPVQVNTVCVAAYEGGWYRCQVVSVDESAGQCDIKYLDYGGYHTLPLEDLKQIRTDFLTLPFQAIECYLANITPKDDENVSAFVLEELIAHQIVQARMIGSNEAGVPMIHLYRSVAGQTTMVNKELVDRSCALWLETTIVKLETPTEVAASAWVASGNFQSMSLLPDPSSQINPIFHSGDPAFTGQGYIGEVMQPYPNFPASAGLPDFWLAPAQQ